MACCLEDLGLCMVVEIYSKKYGRLSCLSMVVSMLARQHAY